MKQMELRGFIYVEPDSLKSVSLDDTDYGDGKETQPDVWSSIITVGGYINDWWLAKYHSVSDSSCEAEYKELAKCAKGVKKLHMILGEINLVDLPGVIRKDIEGDIFFSSE